MSNPEATELRKRLAEIVKQAKAINVSDGKGWSGFTYITDGKHDIDKFEALINTEVCKALDKLTEEVLIDERMAWSDEDGSHMETKVFQTNFKNSLAKVKAEYEVKE